MKIKEKLVFILQRNNKVALWLFVLKPLDQTQAIDPARKEDLFS